MTVKRDLKGRLLPGVRLNPAGRSKALASVVEEARKHTADAIRVAASIMNDTKASSSSRIAAAELLLNRGWGKPTQSVELPTDPAADSPLSTASEIDTARRVALILEKGIRLAHADGYDVHGHRRRGG